MAGGLLERGKKRGLLLAQEKASDATPRGGLSARGKTRDQVKNQGGIAGGIGYAAGNLGIGVAGVGEGILDLAVATQDLIRGDTDMAKYRFLDSNTAKAQQSLAEWYNPGKGMQFAGDVASGIGQSSVFLLDALVPGLGTGLFFGGITGQSVAGAAQQTGDVGIKEIGYGVASGAAEAALGKLVGAGGKVAGKLGSSLTRSTGKAVGQRGITNALTKATGKRLAGMGWNVAQNTLADAAGEFTEEFTAEYIDAGLQRLFGIDPHASTSFGEALRAGAVGFVSGATMSAPANVYNYKNSVAAGKAIREDGGVNQLLYRAAATVDVLKEQEEQAREKGRTKATVPEDAGVVGKTAAKGKQAVANLGAKITASKTKGYWEKLEKNISAYMNMGDAMRNSDVGDALLGELRGNLFFTNMSYAVEEAEEALRNATDEEITEWLVEVNDKAKKAGKADASYTVEDFRANKDGILSTVAAAFWIDEIRRTEQEKKSATESSQTTQEAAGATEAVQAEEVDTKEKNTAEIEEQGLETDPWEPVKGVEGFGTQNQQEADLLKAAVTNGVPKETIPAMLNSFREGTDMTPSQFANAWADGVMFFGRYGLNEATISEDSNLYRMSENARRASIREGKIIADEETRRAQEKAEKKKIPARNEADAKRKQESGGKIIKGKGLIVKDLRPEQYAAYKAAEALAHVLGTDIEIETSLADTAGKQTNGYYDAATNKLHININAKRDGKSIALYTLGHEVAHYIKKWSPTKFRALSDFVMEHLGKDAEGLIAAKVELLRKIPDYKDYTVAQLNDLAAEEVVADGMELVLADGKIVDELARTDESIWKRMKDFIKKVISDIKKYFSGLNQASKTAQVLKETVESLEEIERLFTEGVREAGERTRTAGVETNTKTKRKYSVEQSRDKITVGMSDSDRTQILQSKKIIAPIYTGQADQLILVNKDDLESGQRGLVKAAIVRIGDELGVFADYNISDVDVMITLSKGNLRESISKDATPTQIAKLLPVLKQAVENAIGIESHDNRYYYDTVTVRFDNLMGGFIDGEYFVPVRFGLKQSVDGHIALYVVVDQNKIDLEKIRNKKTEVIKAASPHEVESSTSRSVSYSISQIIPFVNSVDVLRYIPDDMLTNEQKNVKYQGIADTIRYTNEKNDRKYSKYISENKLDAAKQMVRLAALANGYIFQQSETEREGIWIHSETGQVKSGAVITYDDNGNVIPLSERFKEDNSDIRYSIDETPETPDVSVFDEALRRSGLADIVDGLDEVASEAEPMDESEVDRRQRIQAHEMLANSLMEAAQTEQEFVLVKKYQKKAAELADAEMRIEELRKKTASVNRDIEMLESKKETIDRDRPEPEVKEAEAWIENELGEAKARKQSYMEEMDRLGKLLRDETGKLLSIAAAKPLRKTIREAQRKATAMELSAKRSKEREKATKEWAKATVKQARTEANEQKRESREWAKATVKKIRTESNEKIYKARRDATDYKRAVYRTAYEKAEEKNRAYRERTDRKADESRERKEMTARKRTIMRVLGGLQTKLVHPTKTNHAPKELHDLVQTVMRTADPKAWDANRKNIREMGDLAAAIEKLERQATRTAKEQERLDAMKSKYEILEQQTMPLAKQAQAMYAAYKQYNDTLPEDMRIPESVMTEMSEMIDKIEDVTLKEMGLESLKAVETFVKALSTQINNANELFVRKRGEQVSDWGNAASREAAESKPLKWLSPKSMEIKNARDVRDFLWKNMKPLTAFEAIGSPKLMELFQSVLDGEEVWITDVLEAREAIVKAKEKYGYDTWDLNIRREFTNGEGKTVKLTVGEMMSLYAYAKREQAMGHLRGGGFVLDAGATEITEKNKIRTTKILNLTERYTMTEEDMGKLAGMLTEEQKQYATEIQDYLTSLGEKGNEISRKLYGLDLFNEKHYFPIKVKSEYLESQTGKTGDPKIKNRGMSKETVPDAQNPLVLQDFMTIVSGHVNDMATYHAFVLPVEDLTRVLNYQPSNAIIDEDGNWTEDKERKEYSTLKAVIESKYGAQANAYIEQLIRDLNGGARREAAANLIDKGITAFKRASTMASLSVLVQQPTSVFRAMAYVDPKHFRSLAALDIKGHKEAWEQVKTYAKVAAIKEMGGYDTGVGTRTADYLNSKDYKTWGERAKAFFLPDVYGGDSNYRAEIFGKGAAYADELAWIQMFDACKREQAEKLGKPMDSEEVLEAAGERFTEVVRRTQVYDSTLTRSEYMRSKDTGMKMATAFMAEPTTVVSMMLDGLIRANRGDKAFLKKTAGAIAASVIFNALAVSLIYAARDDDEEKTYTEKYLATLATETAEGFNPLEYLPYTRDVMSLMKGYDIERTDMALFADLFKAFERITSSTRTPVEKTAEVAGAVGAFFGVPIRNLVRDAMMPVNLVQGAMSGERTTGKGISAAMADEFSLITNLFGADTTNAHQLYKAAKSGDEAHYNRVASRYKSEQAAEMALRTALRENDKRIAEAAEAKISGELEAYESIVEQIEGEGRFDRNLIIRAINNEVLDIKDNADQVVIPEEEVTDEEDETPESLYNTSDLNDALTRGDREDFEDIYYYLLATKQEQGKTEAQAKAAVKSGITSYWKKQYLAAWEENNTAEMKRILELLEETELYGEYNDVATMAQKWIQES